MSDEYFKKILDLVKQERNLDLSQYRDKLLQRRVMTRVRATKRDDFEHYHAHLKVHQEEIDSLMDALTINVTEFFRDPHVFDVIEKRVLPDLMQRKKRLNSDYIRVWSCACSSGEEAYSILMLLSEHLGPRFSKYRVKIFGTDIDSGALSTAKTGVYEHSSMIKLSEEKRALIEKYAYDMGNKKYWFREELPSYMNFKFHDVTADVPLEVMDIVFCRNLFIYFDRVLQSQVLQRLHGAAYEVIRNHLEDEGVFDELLQGVCSRQVQQQIARGQYAEVIAPIAELLRRCR